MSLGKKHPLEIMDDWFRRQCDGHWENFFGISLETTDNPGWLMTIRGHAINEANLSKLVGSLLSELGAQVSFDKTSVRIYSPTLLGCITAASQIFESASLGEKIRAPASGLS